MRQLALLSGVLPFGRQGAPGACAAREGAAGRPVVGLQRGTLSALCGSGIKRLAMLACRIYFIGAVRLQMFCLSRLARGSRGTAAFCRRLRRQP